MTAPVQRTVGPPDLTVVTLSLPHLMFYAPNLTNADIGAAEKAKLLAAEAPLLRELCAYRDLLRLRGAGSAR